MLGFGRQDPPLDRLLRLLRLLQWVAFAVIVVVWGDWWATRSGLEFAPASLTAGAMAAAREFVGQPTGRSGSSAEPRPEPRTAAPDFELSLFDGGTLRLAELRGQVAVVNFWASWCPPCRAEAPTFATVSKAYAQRGVAFVGVDIQDDDQDARAFLAEFGIDYPNGPDRTTRIATDYRLAGIPTTLFIDAEGRIARRWLGGLDEQQLVGFIEETRR